MIEWHKHEDKIHATLGDRFCVIAQAGRMLSVYFCEPAIVAFASVDAVLFAVEQYLTGQLTAQQIAAAQDDLGAAEFQTLEELKCSK